MKDEFKLFVVVVFAILSAMTIVHISQILFPPKPISKPNSELFLELKVQWLKAKVRDYDYFDSLRKVVRSTISKSNREILKKELSSHSAR